MIFNHQVKERKEYPDYGGGTRVVTVGQREGRFTVFEIKYLDYDGKQTRFEVIEMRYVGDTKPDSALQISVDVTTYNGLKGRPHTSHASFSLPADMAMTWVATLFPSDPQEANHA